MDIRDAFFNDVYQRAIDDERIVFLTADADAFVLKRFKEDMPDRFINVGVAEQNAILVATGLAFAGYRPYVYSITPFMTMRCYEQIKVNICSHNLPVTLVGLGAGLSFGFDGPTHHAMHDIGIMKMLPEMDIYNTSDSVTAITSNQLSYESERPSYIRVDKGDYTMVDGGSLVGDGIRRFGYGNSVHIYTTGTILHSVLSVVNGLGGVSPSHVGMSVFDVFKLKDLDIHTIRKSSIASRVLIIDEHSVVGGLIDSIKSALSDFSPNVSWMGLPHKQISEYGDRQWLLSKYRLDEDEIRRNITYLLAEGSSL